MADGIQVDHIGAITAYIFIDSRDETVDQWATLFHENITALSPDQPCLVLMDVSAKNVSFTGYARQRSQELFRTYKSRRGRMAFLFSSRTAPHYARIFFASIGRMNFQISFFSDRAKALKWLQEAEK